MSTQQRLDHLTNAIISIESLQQELFVATIHNRPLPTTYTQEQLLEIKQELVDRFEALANKL